LSKHERTVLVTGGAGFIGRNFVLDSVRAGGHKVVNLDALTYAGNLDTVAPIGMAWLDAGTHESLQQTTNFVQTIEERQGLKIGCPEEVAYHRGYINAEQLEQLALSMRHNSYGQYLLELLRREEFVI
jgi:dTDP-glucose pyrophosphorylase